MSKEPLTIDDLGVVQRKIETHRHLMAAARAGFYAIQAHPGQEEAFSVNSIPSTVHSAIEKALYEAAANIREDLLDGYNVEIGKDT
jgi:hypothetical protein